MPKVAGMARSYSSLHNKTGKGLSYKKHAGMTTTDIATQFTISIYYTNSEN
jgi:hypothetical protein